MAQTAKISFHWVDGEGTTSGMTTPLHFDLGDVATLAEAQAQATLYETALHAVSGCAIDRMEVTFGLSAAGTESPDAGYRTRTGATLSFLDSDGVGQSIYIPGILDDKILDGVVDSSDTEVAALINAILGNVGGTDPVSSRGSASAFDSYVGGKQSNRKV